MCFFVIYFGFVLLMLFFLKCGFLLFILVFLKLVDNVRNPAPTSTCIPQPGDFGVGRVSVICTAHDSSSNQAACSFFFVVTDNEAPVLTCPASFTVAILTSVNYQIVNWNISATDNCDSALSITCVPSAGNLFAAGDTFVNCAVKDASQNSASCSFVVSVDDLYPPGIVCPSNQSYSLPSGQASASVAYSVSASDNVGLPTITCTPPSGSAFPVGGLTVSCQARDVAGNTNACYFGVVVYDAEPPSIQCPLSFSKILPTGQRNMSTTWSVPAIDNVAVVRTFCTPNTSFIFGFGIHSVVCTAYDSANNSASCSFLLTIVDLEPPTITCPNSIRYSTEPGLSYNSNLSIPLPIVTDNVAIETLSCSVQSGFRFPVGETAVSCYAQDTSRNLQSCSFSIKIEDIENPVVQCPNDTVILTLDDSVLVHQTVSSSDNVKVQAASVYRDDVPLATTDALYTQVCDVGTFTTFLFVAHDSANLASSCTWRFTVSYLDTEPPNITNCLKDQTLTITSGVSAVAKLDWEPRITDNIDVNLQPLFQSSPPYLTPTSAFLPGISFLNTTVRDRAGNVGKCSFSITVIDARPVDSAATAMSVTTYAGAGAGVSFLLLIFMVIAIRNRRHIKQLQTDASFKETDESVLARALAIAAAMKQKKALTRPVVRELLDLNLLEVLSYLDVSSLPDNLDLFELPRQDVILEKEIGSGEFGKIFIGRVQKAVGGSSQVAVKMLKGACSSLHIDAFDLERVLLRQLNHANVVRLVGYVSLSQPALVCLEFMELGSLRQYIESEAILNSLSNQEMISFAIDICTGMHFVHENGIVHRDLAARNVLINGALQCKVADFGLAVICVPKYTSINLPKCDTLPFRWTAPESIRDGVWSAGSDVWSFGIVLWELWNYGKLPYGDWSNQRVVTEVTNNVYRLPPPTGCPMLVYAVMMDCWQESPDSRITFKKAYTRLVYVWDECSPRPEESTYTLGTAGEYDDVVAAMPNRRVSLNQEYKDIKPFRETKVRPSKAEPFQNPLYDLGEQGNYNELVDDDYTEVFAHPFFQSAQTAALRNKPVDAPNEYLQVSAGAPNEYLQVLAVLNAHAAKMGITISGFKVGTQSSLQQGGGGSYMDVPDGENMFSSQQGGGGSYMDVPDGENIFSHTKTPTKRESFSGNNLHVPESSGYLQCSAEDEFD